MRQENASVAEAIEYLRSYERHSPTTGPAVKFEIEVRYKNGDLIRGTYQNKYDAIRDLRHWTA